MRKIYFGSLIVLLALVALSPLGNEAYAAAQCPPGLKADVGLGILNATCNSVNTDGSLGAVVGKAFDSESYGAIPANCAAGTYPMWLPSQGTASEPPACVSADGKSSDINGAGESIKPNGPELKECQKANIYSADGIYYGVRCAGNSIIIALSASVVGISTSVLDLSSYLLNVSLEKTVVNFGTLYDSISAYVGQVWSMFRDLANILLIGLFVFIAISIILGLEQFGQKKLIARVIIIAILINFSFLFTLIAINSSNALASYVYNNTMKTVVQTSGTGATGIGDVFKKLLKTSSVKETTDAMVDMNNADNGGLSTVLLHTVFAVIFQIAAALVFLYGALLLAARFVILIVLLVISAAAFATYLSPSMASSDYGWSGWWNQLLRNSFFAPLLMIFLFAALKISTGIAAGSGSLGGLSKVGGVADPATVATVLNYIFILGFLWLGIYISSHVAGGAANRLALGGAALGVNIPGKALAALGRWSIGGRAAVRSHEAEAGYKSRAREIAALDPIKDKAKIGQLRSEMLALGRQKGRSDYLAKSSFDMANLKSVQKLNAAAGLSGVFGKTDKSYDKTAHAQDDKAIKEAIKAAVSNKDAEKISRKEHGEDSEGYTNAERSHKQSERLVAAAEAIRDSQKHSEGLITRMEDSQKKLLESTARRTEIGSNTKISEAERRTLIAAEDHKIATINGDLRGITARMKEIDREHSENIKTARATADITNAAVKSEKSSINTMRNAVQKRSSDNAVEVGRLLSGGPLTRAVRQYIGPDLDPGQSHHVTDAVRGRTEGKFLDKVGDREKITKATAKDEPHAHAPTAGGGAAPAH